MNSTSAVEVSIHAVLPVSSFCATGDAASAAGAAVIGAAPGASAGLGLSWAKLDPIKPKNASKTNSFFMMLSLKRLGAGFSCAYADDMREIGDENFAVANLAGVRRFFDRFNHLVEQIVLDGDFKLDLG